MIKKLLNRKVCFLLAVLPALLLVLAACSPQTAAQAEHSPVVASASPAASPDGQTLICTVSVSCTAALESGKCSKERTALLPKDGWLYPVQKVFFTQGETVLAVLKRAAKAGGVPLDVSEPTGGSAYVKGIGNLYEKTCGGMSGWLYKVNGAVPSSGAADYVLKDGDVVEWAFSCDLGRDMGWGS